MQIYQSQAIKSSDATGPVTFAPFSGAVLCYFLYVFYAVIGGKNVHFPYTISLRPSITV